MYIYIYKYINISIYLYIWWIWTCLESFGAERVDMLLIIKNYKSMCWEGFSCFSPCVPCGGGGISCSALDGLTAITIPRQTSMCTWYQRICGFYWILFPCLWQGCWHLRHGVTHICYIHVVSFHTRNRHNNKECIRYASISNWRILEAANSKSCRIVIS